MKQIHVLLQTLLLIIISENKYFALLLLPARPTQQWCESLEVFGSGQTITTNS
jgi:hypothetical protein